jgi:hypothetical protein
LTGEKKETGTQKWEGKEGRKEGRKEGTREKAVNSKRER